MTKRFVEVPFKTGAHPNNGRSRFPWFGLAASTILIVIVLYFADISEVFATLSEVRFDWLGVAILCQLVGPVIISLRWQRLLAAQDVTPPWRYLFASTLMSTFFRQFLPSTAGGDVIRAYHAMKAGASTSVALMSLVVDRLGGLVALLILAIIGTIMGPAISERLPDVWMWISAVGIALCLVTSIVVFGMPTKWGRLERLPKLPFMGKVGALLVKFSDALSLYRGKPMALLYALIMSLILQVNIVVFFWAISMALDLQLSLAVFFVVVPIAIMVMMLPISINGIGLREGVFVFLLGGWGISPASSVSLAWIEYGIFLAFGLLGGVIYGVANMQLNSPEKHDENKVCD